MVHSWRGIVLVVYHMCSLCATQLRRGMLCWCGQPQYTILLQCEDFNHLPESDRTALCGRGCFELVQVAFLFQPKGGAYLTSVCLLVQRREGCRGRGHAKAPPETHPRKHHLFGRSFRRVCSDLGRSSQGPNALIQVSL